MLESMAIQVSGPRTPSDAVMMAMDLFQGYLIDPGYGLNIRECIEDAGALLVETIGARGIDVVRGSVSSSDGNVKGLLPGSTYLITSRRFSGGTFRRELFRKGKT